MTENSNVVEVTRQMHAFILGLLFSIFFYTYILHFSISARSEIAPSRSEDLFVHITSF